MSRTEQLFLDGMEMSVEEAHQVYDLILMGYANEDDIVRYEGWRYRNKFYRVPPPTIS